MENKKKLYDALSTSYDLGDFDTFAEDVKDDAKRKKLYDAIKDSYDLGDFDSFSNQLLGSTKQTPNSLSDSLLNNSEVHPDSTIAQLREDTKKREEAAEKAYNESEVIYNEDKPYRPASVPQLTPAPAEGIVKAESDKLVQEQEVEERVKKNWELMNAPDEVKRLHNTMAKLRNFTEETIQNTANLDLNPAQREFEQKMDEINQAQRFGKITPQEAFVKRIALGTGYRFSSTPTDDMIRRTNARGVAELSKSIEEQKSKRYNELDEQYDLSNPYWVLSPTQNQSLIKGDQEYRTLMAAENALNDAQKLIEEVENLKSQEDYAEWRKTFNSLGRGAADKLFDVRTWDMGVKDMADATMLYKALDKADAGEELTDAERSLLDAKAYEMAVNAYFGSDVSRAYKLGGGLAQTIPFMFEMAINPIAGVGSAAQNKLVRYALKKLGKGFYQKKLKYNALKYGTRLLGDLAGGAGLALTSSLGSTSADAISRMDGQVKPQYDKWGEASFGGTESGVSAGKAIRQAVTAATLERFSEMLGYYPSRMLRGFNPMDKMLDKPKLKDVKEFFDKASHTTVARGMREFQKKTRWDGHLSEYFEEVANNVLNGIFVGDMKFDTSEQGIFNRENNIDTYLQCLIMAGGMSAIQTGYYPIHKYKQLNNYKKADSEGAEAFGDEWEGIKSSLSQINESGKQAWESLMEREDVTPKQKEVATRYFGANAALQAAEQADFKRVADENTSPEEVEISQSYDIGRSLYTPEEMNEAKRELEDAKADVRRTYSLEEDRDVDEFLGETPLESIRGSLELGGSMEEAEIKLRYLNAKAKYDGMLDAVSDKVNDEVARSNALIDRQVNKTMNGIQQVTLNNGEEVFVIDGVIAANEDGSIDRENTDKDVIYLDGNGKAQFTSRDNISSAKPFVDVATYKQQNANNIIEQGVAESAAKIDGVLAMNVGDKFYVMDDRGLAHQAQVTANFEDGNVAISLDNAEPQHFSREAVQAMANAYKDAEYQEKKAAQEEKERADMQQTEAQLQQEEDEKKQAQEQAQQAEQPQTATSRVPVGENGNLLYEQVDSDTAWDALVEQAKGNEATAQKIADMGVKKAQKALNEVKQSSINEDMSIEEMLEAENAHNDAVAAAEANLNKWKEIATTPQRRAEEAQRVAETEAKAEAMQERIDKANEAISEEQKKAEPTNVEDGSSSPQMRADEGVQPAGKKLSRAMNMLRIPLRKRINDWNKKVGVPAVIVEDFSDVASQKAKANILEAESKDRRVTGWVEDGKVYLYMPNLRDIDEIDETYTHEVVAHKGMDAMLGKEEYRKFCLDVFDQVMTEADRKFYLKYEGVKEIKDEQEKKAKAADEYIAHLSESTNLTKREAKLWDKIVDLFRKMLESLGFPQDISKLTIEDMIRKSYKNLLEKKDAGKLEDTVIEAAQNLEENGAQVDVQRGDVRNAVRDVLSPKQKEKTIKDIMAVTGRSRSTVEKWLKAEQSLAKIILDNDNEAFLDLQVDESVPSIWNNSDYPQGTVEFSNICRKRLPLTMIYQQLQKEYPNTVFDAATLETIRGVLKENGVDVACGLCFVEDRRQLLGEIGQGFIDALKGKDVKLNDKQKEIVEKIKASGDTYIPNLYELITLDGMKELKRNHNEIANAFVAYNSARGMQAGRLFQAYSAYHREMLKYNKKKIKSINDAGGLRIFSFSDFEAHHLIDLVQVLTDCASKGIKVQGYTKVPEFARAVKATNMKVNRSLIAKGDGVVDADYVPQQGEAVSPNVINGKRLLLDTVEGIDVNHPDFFDSSSSANVGNILVGINDEHIRQAMLDPFVDYIIPFHTGIKKDILKKKGIDSWQNYKLEQLEHIRKENGKESNADKHGINIYTEVLNEDIKTEKQFVERYLEVCKEKGWLPKFHRFLEKDKNGDFKYTKGYYKLLLDFKLFNKNGRILPQEAVVPIFDNELNGRILEEYAEGERTKMPNTEVYDKVKDALKEEGKIQFSVKDNEATETIFATAKEKFGTTYDMREAGYILPDGSMLDFSGKHEIRGVDTSFLNGQRSVDHRAIQDIAYDFDENETGVKTDLGDFLDRGAIRIDYNTGAINLNNAPTKAQKDRLKRLIERNGGDVYIDFGKGWDTEHYVEYESARASRVLGDIDRYYEEGIKPSSNIRFRTAPAFYSNAERAVENIKQEKATPEQWLKMIEKNGGLKAGEDKWLGLSDWLKASDKKTLTKQEVLDYIKANEIQIEEVVYGSLEDTPRFKELRDEYKSLLVENDYNNERTFEAMVDKYGDDFDLAFEGWGNDLHINSYYGTESAETFLDARDINDTRIQYTTDGLDNKREIALVVPTIESWNESDEIHFGDAGNGRAIAWVRFGETTDAEGNRVLVIDEVQSKRHQEGREKGYNNPRVIEILNRLGTIESYMYSPQGMSGKMFSEREALKAELESLFEADNPVMKATAEQIDEKKSKRAALLKEKSEREDDERVEIIKLQNKQDEVRNVRDYDCYESEINEIQERIDQRNEELDLLASDITALNNEYSRYYNTELRNARIGVSPAPFEKNWAELAMKRMLRYAAENGFDKVAWTTGEQQADRYDIGGVIGAVKVTKYPRGIEVVALGKEGNIVHSDVFATEGAIADVYGKEMAVKIVQSAESAQPAETTTLSGDNLHIGGSGMKAFYDQMIPSFMNKYGKKWGVKVGEVTMPNLEENNSMHSVDVTPAMRESVMQGQPMFRVTQDKARFDELQKEYDALDKNDEVALNAWRDKNKLVVGQYIREKVAEFALPCKHFFVYDSEKEADLRKYFELFLLYVEKLTGESTIRENTDENFEYFKNAVLKNEDGGYNELLDLIVINTSKPLTEKWVVNCLFHEEAHAVVKKIIPANVLPKIWEEAKTNGYALASHIEESYNEDEKRGEEVLTYSIGSIAQNPITRPLLEQFIKGEGDVVVNDILDIAKSSLPLRNEYLTKILNFFRDERRKEKGDDIRVGVLYPEGLDGFDGLLSRNRGDRKRGGSRVLDSVSQKGLRGVVSEDALISFFKGVYNRVDNATRNEIYEYVKRNGNDFWKGTEQYLASLAESNAPLDGGVRDAFVQMLNNNGIEAEGLTDNDIRYMMWRTNQLQNNKGALSVAEDVVMKQKLGVDNAQPDANISFRVVSNGRSIRDKYDKRVNTGKGKLKATAYNFQEAMQDEMLSLKIYQQLLEEVYGVNIPSYLNVYNAENSLSSRNKVEMDRFVETFYEDMMQEIDKLIKAGATEQEVRDYVIAKSGIERSIEFTVRDYINEQAETTLITEKEANKQREAVSEKLRNNEITPAEADYMRSQINQQRNTKKHDAKAIEGMRKLYEEKRDALRDRLKWREISFDEWVDESLALAQRYTGKEVTDAAGLSAMAKRMGLEDKDWLSNARKVANEFENKYNGKVDEFDVKINTRYLWDAINACNNATLNKLYDTGVISKDLYDKLQKQFMFYVPMSGFTEDVAEDVYSYIGNETGAFTPPIKKAGGRLSESDDPFAIIGNKMQSAILQGNRNAMKIKFLNLHRQFPTDLITEGRFWEVKQPDGSWLVEYPEIPSKDASAEVVKAAVDEFNERMKRLKESGDARIYRGKANVPYKITHKSHENQHQITVRLMGEPITMFVNGNPQLAKAINGKLKSTTTFWFYNGLASINRYMSSIVTSFNPDFVAPNVVRDVQQAFTMTLMDYGVKDAGKLAGLLPKALATTIKYANDIDIDPEIKTLYEEFLLNGGQTGYSHIDDIDKWKSRNKSRIDRLSGVAKVAQGAVDGFLFVKDGISTINGFFEDTTRFATYMLNRQNGKSIGDSIKAAKDISTNFNKKGSGATEGIWGAAAEFLRHWIMFFNPMVQGAYQHWDKMKKHTKKYALITAWNIGLGFTAALLNDMGSADDEEMHYLNQNEYTRRSNLFIYIGDSYIKIPLAPVFREYYAIGDIIYTAIKGRITAWQATKAIFNTVRSIFSLEGQSSLTGKDGEKFRLGRFVAPDALAVIPDIAENANFMGSPIYRDAPWDELKPEYEKVYNGTWQPLINISKGINNMMATDIEDETLSKHTGKIAAKNSSILINPAVWQYAIEQATGGIGSTIGNTINTVGAVFDPEREVEWNSVPIIRRFYTVPNERNRSRNLQNDYYEITQEQKRRRDLYDFEKADTEGKADEILKQLQAEENAYLKRVEATKNDAFGRAELEANYHSKEKNEERKNRLAEAERLRQQFKAYQESPDGQFYLKTEEIIKAVDKLRREIKKVEDDNLKKQKKSEMEAKMQELVDLWKADERK